MVATTVDTRVSGLTASLDLSGTGNAAVGSVEYARGLRAGIAAVLSSGRGAAAPVLIDMVFIAALAQHGR
jgi:hypothetical protein